MSMKKYFFIGLLLPFSLLCQAQIGVNTTDPVVTLDVQATATDGSTAEGLVAPRLTLAQLISKDAKYTTTQTGAVIYATNVTGATTAKTKNVTAIGYYYFDGTLWQSMGGGDPALKFFYMPSVVLTTNTADPTYNAATQTFTLDLYRIYADQFGMTSSATTAKNPGALSPLTVLPNTALDYLIVYFDNAVYQNVAVSDAGVLTYKLVPSFVFSDKTFMNIVFKVK